MDHLNKISQIPHKKIINNLEGRYKLILSNDYLLTLTYIKDHPNKNMFVYMYVSMPDKQIQIHDMQELNILVDGFIENLANTTTKTNQ